MAVSQIRVGTENQKGFTPQAQKLKPEDISNKISCVLYGPGIDRPTDIHIRRGYVSVQLDKAKEAGQTLIIPASYDVDAEREAIKRAKAASTDQPVTKEPASQPVEAPQPSSKPVPERIARVMAKNKPTPVICLNTGRFFESANKMASAYGLVTPHVRAVITGKTPYVKGRSVRLATPEEIQQYEAGTYKFSEPLLPINHSAIRNFKNRYRKTTA